MMYGFETRLLTDKVLKLFLDSIPKIDSSGVQMMKKTRPHAMFNPITGKRYNFNPNEELEYNDFELETWKEQKTPICYWGTLRGTKKLRKLSRENPKFCFVDSDNQIRIYSKTNKNEGDY